MVLDGIGWYWMVLDGIGWYWMVLDGIGWYWMVLDGILPLGSECVDTHIFTDPDPGSQNVADTADPDSKH